MKKRILLVDDDLDCLEIFKYLLDAEGYEVIAVSRPNLPIENYDLIILDENLQDLQGSDLCDFLKILQLRKFR